MLRRSRGREAPRVGWTCVPGGDGGVQVVNDAANRVAEGRLKIALVGGCEVPYSRRRALAREIDRDEVWTPGWRRPPPPRGVGQELRDLNTFTPS